jgi:RND family efflux transporter MFP subunit
MKKPIYLVALVLLSACGAPETEEAAESKTRPNVAVEPVEKKERFAHWISFQASVEAQKNVVLNAETGGVIRSITVEEGQFVKAGRVLVVLDSDIMSQNINELEEAISLAEYVRDKQKKLYAQNIGTEFDLKQAESQVEQLNRKLSTLRTQAGKSVLVAPFDGYVESIGSYVGELAAPQIPLVRFVNLDKVTIVAEVSEAYLNQIKPGTLAEVDFPTLDTVLTNLTVTRTGRIINPANRTFRVEIDIDNKDNKIVPNLLAEVRFQNELVNNALIIESRSILEDKDGKRYVYAMNSDSLVFRKYIETGFSYNGLTHVTKGLKSGEKVVVEGAEGLTDSLRVDVLKY